MILLLLMPSAVLFLYGAHRLFLTVLAVRARRRGEPVPPPAPSRGVDPPFVTVQLPIFDERLVARRLVEAAAAMRWPRDRFEIQVLDDSTDETTAIVAQVAREVLARGIAIEHVRRGHRRGYKAGALAEGLRRSRGTLVATFDADFLPPPEFLERTVPWFRDPRTALVQARWSFLNEDAGLLTKAQATMLRGHFRIEHLARARTGRAFNFNGTAGIWRRAAIDDAGGWQADTLTEDLDLSYRAFLRGWRFRYVDDLACPSELPPTVKAFRAQQFRWAKGIAQVARKLLPGLLRAPIPTRLKVEALFHLLAPCVYPFVLVAYLAWLPLFLARPEWAAASSWRLGFGGFLFATLSGGVFYGAAERVAGPRSLAAFVLRYLQLLVVGIGNSVNATWAVVEGFAGSRSPFRRTPKYAAIGKRRDAGPAAYRLGLDRILLLEAGVLAYAVALSIAAFAWIPLAAPWALLFLVGWGVVVGAQVRETLTGRG